MDKLQIFHMNKGEGQDSYANNCTIQSKIQSISEKLMREAMKDYLAKQGVPPDTVTLADLGCSSGPTSLATVTWLTDAVSAASGDVEGCRCPDMVVYLNDLPGNDFDKVLGSLLPEFRLRLKNDKGDEFCNKCFVFGCPGNFYGRLFPTEWLHFVHSSSSLHWLSQVPIELDVREKGEGAVSRRRRERVNKGKIYISKGSPSWVIKAYMNQFMEDLDKFLRCRSKEVVTGGRMVLTLMCRKSIDPALDHHANLPWDLLAQSLLALVDQGLIEEEKVDNFNVPFFAPCVEEVMTLIHKQASFSVHRFGSFELDWDGGDPSQKPNGPAHIENGGPTTIGDRISRIHRAVVEPMFQHHFGPHVMDQLFFHYRNKLDSHLSKHSSKVFNVVISLIKN